jgi:hypothetical protein
MGKSAMVNALSTAVNQLLILAAAEKAVSLLRRQQTGIVVPGRG